MRLDCRSRPTLESPESARSRKEVLTGYFSVVDLRQRPGLFFFFFSFFLSFTTSCLCRCRSGALRIGELWTEDETDASRGS
jgi:hypothetical protein